MRELRQDRRLTILQACVALVKGRMCVYGMATAGSHALQQVTIHSSGDPKGAKLLFPLIQLWNGTYATGNSKTILAKERHGVPSKFTAPNLYS